VIVGVAIALYAYSKSRKPKTDSSAVAQSPKDDDKGNGSGNKNIAPNNTYSQTQQPQTLQQTPAQSATYTTPPPPPLPIQQEETEQLSWKGEKLRETIQIFQQKGAISPQTALTAKELGLSRIFERIIERRGEKTKIFVQINGKYYLDQKALADMKQQRAGNENIAD
jgi:hypothetical protein